tara:strand:+ start:914 stop:1063 length:150 start_codon:yes stop_codon:yes gene_type:complete
MLDIYAGKNALKIIQEHGFKQALFTNFLGAPLAEQNGCLCKAKHRHIIY